MGPPSAQKKKGHRRPRFFFVLIGGHKGKGMGEKTKREGEEGSMLTVTCRGARVCTRRSRGGIGARGSGGRRREGGDDGRQRRVDDEARPRLQQGAARGRGGARSPGGAAPTPACIGRRGEAAGPRRRLPRSRSGRGERDEGVGVSSIQIGSRGGKVERRGVRVSGCEGIREWGGSAGWASGLAWLSAGPVGPLGGVPFLLFRFLYLLYFLLLFVFCFNSFKSI